MIRDWLNRTRQRRSVRKFQRNHLAIAALVVVCVYLLIAVSTGVFGVIRLEDTFARVGPNSVSGFFLTQLPEKRVEDCYFYLERVEQALSRGDPRAALADLRYGQLVVAGQGDAGDIALVPAEFLRLGLCRTQARNNERARAGKSGRTAPQSWQ